jgi:hypothetical protein
MGGRVTKNNQTKARTQNRPGRKKDRTAHGAGYVCGGEGTEACA